MPVAVFNRILVQGKRRLAMLTEADSSYEVNSIDPHDQNIPIEFYDFVEALVRSAHLKLQGTLSRRFETLVKEYIRPFAMRKQTDKNFLDFRQPVVLEYLCEPNVFTKLQRVFEYFITSYKQNKLKSNTVGVRDVTMSFNHAFVVLEKCDMFDPAFTIKKTMESYCKVTLDSDLLPQEHPNNQNSEMVLYEFMEFLLRCARAKVCTSIDL